MLLSELGLSIPLFQRGAGGIPTTRDDGTDLSDRCDGYQHRIAARGGFESMTTGYRCSLAEAKRALFGDWLGRSTIVKGPAMQTIWEGQLCEITATLGQRSRSISLDTVANRVRVRYSLPNGGADVTTILDDLPSQAIYGVKDAVIALGSTAAAAAANAAGRYLAQWAYPVQRPSTQIATGGGGDIRLDFLFRGWYFTLDWVLHENSSEVSTTTNTQITTLIGGGGIGGMNAFIDPSGSLVDIPGVSDTEFTAPDTPYMEKIESLVEQGDGSERWVLMCLEDRKLTFRKWAGATPGTIHYVADLGGHQVYTPQGALVPPWDVRPDRMYQEIGLLDATPVATADDATRQYVERVVCSIDAGGAGVTIEPAATDSLDVLLSALS